MNRALTTVSLSLLVSLVLPLTASADEPGKEFTGTAVVKDSQGTRQMPVTLLVNRFTPAEEAQQLSELLNKGGQGTLVSALRGRNDGQIRLGALQLPVALVTVEPARRGYRYLFVTPRRIKVDEEEFGKDSLNYPFGIAVFEVSDWGKGEGQLHVAAALHIDTDGHVEVDDYNGAEGRFKDVKKVR